MRRTFPWLSLVTLFLMLLPVLAADDASDPTPKPEAPTKKQVDKLIKSGKSFIGKLVKIDADKRMLTIEVTFPKQNPQAAQHLANLQAQLIDAQRRRNPADRLAQTNRIQLEMEKATQNLIKGQTQKIDFDAPEEMKVRTMLLPLEFDDKGKPRKLTEKEKRELKGPDPTLPGYTAEFDGLKADQTVEIYLAKQPSKSKTTSSRRSDDAVEDKDKDADQTESTRPKIAMIVIRAEARK